MKRDKGSTIRRFLEVGALWAFFFLGFVGASLPAEPLPKKEGKKKTTTPSSKEGRTSQSRETGDIEALRLTEEEDPTLTPGLPLPEARPSQSAAPGITRERNSGFLVIEKSGPESIVVGESFTYILQVTNRGDTTLREVYLFETPPEGFKLLGTDPAPQRREGRDIIWFFDSIPPQASMSIKITGRADTPGELRNYAYVQVAVPVQHVLRVHQPQIQLTKTGPEEVMLGDIIEYRLTVTNPGTGVARNVVVTDNLPDGLVTPDGRTTVSARLGDIASGGRREAIVRAQPTRRGTFVNPAIAVADGGLRSESSWKTIVRQPILEIEKTGPESGWLGHKGVYYITVTNRGDGIARDTTVTDPIPAGVTLTGASEGARQFGNEVRWKLGDLRPTDSRKLAIEFKYDQIGEVLNVASARATNAEEVRDDARTIVKGIAAILLEVVDLVDPVPVGEVTTYVITATNQGSATGTNVRIVCELEENFSYAGSDGVTVGSLVENRVEFAPLPRLGPGEKATWKVHVRAVKDGDVRFKTQMTTDQLTRPVMETEATNIYRVR